MAIRHGILTRIRAEMSSRYRWLAIGTVNRDDKSCECFDEAMHSVDLKEWAGEKIKDQRSSLLNRPPLEKLEVIVS